MSDSYETDAALESPRPYGSEITLALQLLKADRLLPEDCACFAGLCRGGDVVAGLLSNGLRCRMQVAEALAIGANDNDGAEPD